MAGQELDRSPEERDHARRLVVWQNLGVGQASAIIDGDVHVLLTGRPALHSVGVDPDRRLGLLAIPVMRCPAPRSIRASFLTSMWISSPGRSRS